MATLHLLADWVADRRGGTLASSAVNLAKQQSHTNTNKKTQQRITNNQNKHSLWFNITDDIYGFRVDGSDNNILWVATGGQNAGWNFQVTYESDTKVIS